MHQSGPGGSGPRKGGTMDAWRRRTSLVVLALAGLAAVPAARATPPLAFQPPRIAAVGGSPEALAVADLDGDGRLDVATANWWEGTVSALHGAGDGSLGAPLVV